MKYELKDKALQESYRSIYPYFKEKLDQAMREQIESDYEKVFFSIKPSFQMASHELSFLKALIEAVPEYDPTSWNEWPSTKPTEGSIFRFEIYREAEHDGPESTPEKVSYRGCAYFDGRDLNYNSRKIEYVIPQGEKVRYRPWED